MAKAPTKAQTTTNETVPEIEEDGDLSGADHVSQDTRDTAPADDEPEKAAPAKAEDPREDIVKRYRELRNKAAQGEDDADDGAEGEQDEAEPDQPEAPADKVDAKKDEEPVEKPEQEFELVVDGKTVKKKLNEVIALAQITAAGDNRLDEAKRLLREAQALRGSAKTEHPPSDADEEETHQDDGTQDRGGTREHPPAKRALSPEKLKGIIERIQVGDSDEGVQALQELVEAVAPRDDAETVGRVVEQRLTNMKTEEEIQSALTAFATNYPEIAKDEILADAGRTILRNELIKDLKSVGADEAEIDKIKHDARALAAAQRQLRSNGHKVRSYHELLDEVGKTMATKFGVKRASDNTDPNPPPKATPQPSSTTQSRVERKRTAPQQPRAAGVRGQTPSAPKRKSPADVVAQMRKDRGFPSL